MRRRYTTCGRGAWRSLVARVLWEHEVVGSNPAAPTRLDVVVLVSPSRSAQPEFSELRLYLQTGKAFSLGEEVGEAVRFEIGPPPASPWRANGDRKRFVYLAWLDPEGAIVRRIKLFAQDLPPEAEEVSIFGLDPKGTPACSRARLRPGTDEKGRHPVAGRKGRS